MSKPSVLITGGNRGVGREIFDYFAPNSLSLSRSNGFDIKEMQEEILLRSLEFDIFINYAHNGEFSGQVELLYALFNYWKNKGKNGYIFNVGSYSSFNISKEFKRFSVLKYSLDVANRQCCKEIENNSYGFRMTNLRLGKLIQNEGETGVSSKDIISTIEFLWKTSPDVSYPEIVLTSCN